MGWTAHPDAEDRYPGRGGKRDFPDLPASDRSSPVVGVGALCELGRPRPESERSQGFRISEFVLLGNGNRVTLHDERGVTIGVSGTEPVRDGFSAEAITSAVLTAVLPDDNELGEEAHPWPWLAELAQERGLTVTADELKHLPYEVVLADTVTQWLSGS